MGREAIFKRRSSELEMAEKHYRDTLTALLPAVELATIPERSPVSQTSDEEHEPNVRRRTSDASQRSLASSATSFNDHDYRVDGTKLHNLGWKQNTEFEDALSATVEWYRSNLDTWWNDETVSHVSVSTPAADEEMKAPLDIAVAAN